MPALENALFADIISVEIRFRVFKWEKGVLNSSAGIKGSFLKVFARLFQIGNLIYNINQKIS